MKQSNIFLIGVESSGILSETDLNRIRYCRALILSNRHRILLAPILDIPPTTHMIPIAPVQAALQQASHFLDEGNVVILASGDPLFFGIGRTLLDFFAPDRLVISPAVSTMQLAFSRFKIPWDDASFFSLHGRKTANLASSILGHDKIFLFTDPQHRPDQIAQSLLSECGSEINAHYILHVAENLGMSSECLRTGSLMEIAAQKFGKLTVMILITNASTSTIPSFGLSEDEIVHSRGLITKNEVRAATLHALRLPRQGVFWDIGAGSGAIGLEAARLFPKLQVFAVERQEDQIQNIHRNRKQFQAWNLQVCPGNAPEAVTALPAPDRVFIGGSGGQLQAIIEHAAKKLTPGGRIVVNAVLKKTAQDAPKYLHKMGLHVILSEINVTRSCYLQCQHAQGQPEHSPTIMNPVTVIVGQKISNQEIIDAD